MKHGRIGIVAAAILEVAIGEKLNQIIESLSKSASSIIEHHPRPQQLSKSAERLAKMCIQKNSTKFSIIVTGLLNSVTIIRLKK